MSSQNTAKEAANVIPLRIAEMLGKYPPFTMFQPEQVLELAKAARVKAYVKGEDLWKQGEPPQDEVYFLCRGRVEYLWTEAGHTELVYVRDVGDLLGLTALIEQHPFRVTARITEDAIIYIVDHSALQALLDQHDAARYYVRRHLFWATRVGVRFSLPASQGIGPGGSLHADMDGAQVIRPRPLSRLLTCPPETSIREAARLMTERRVPSIVVVDETRRPIGSLTSLRMSQHCIVESLPVETPVREIMMSPVCTVATGSSAMAAMLYMLRERVGQVCVTEDGSPNSPILDVCTHKDLLAQSGHHPAGMVREIRAAKSTARLRELCDEMEALALSYLESSLSAIFVAQVFAELHDELLLALIEMAKQDLTANGATLPDVDWAWIAVGSDGRREQILRTDMDNAFIFRSSGSDETDAQHRQAFLRLTERVVESLVECGFARCQGGIMASNPKWCLSDREWIREFRKNDFDTDNSLLRLIALFDLRRVAGDSSLTEALRHFLSELFHQSLHLQRQLAEAVIRTPPPLNFWGNFIVEKKGSAGGRFDIKARGLNPIRDAVRLLALKHKVSSVYSTGNRLNALEKALPENTETLTTAYQCYDFMFRLRIQTGMTRGDSGRYIEPEKLTKLQRTSLSNAFDVQRMLQFTVSKEFGLDWK